MKKLITVLCTLVCILSLTACGNKEAEVQYDEQVLSTDLDVAFQVIGSLSQDDQYAEIDNISTYEWMQISNQIKNNYGVVIEKMTIKSAVESFRTASPIIGDIVDAEETQFDTSDDNALVSIILVGSNDKKANFIIYVGENNEITGCQTDVVYTMSEKMKAAGFNTLLGMGTVFSVLILISLIISCFGIFPKIQNMIYKKKSTSEDAIDATIAQITEKEEEELLDDTELIAVIAAAVAIYEGAASTDGFTVRSIRKANASKWKNSLK
jgi:Na+-transporting methylmalonyl-CoA/oxaloacetate decarboxylase gamma subunit